MELQSRLGMPSISAIMHADHSLATARFRMRASSAEPDGTISPYGTRYTPATVWLELPDHYSPTASTHHSRTPTGIVSNKVRSPESGSMR